ncbi:MAG: signal peptidase II [Cyanobacteria bacterium HKST-UBA06]|nr:signal peptidase II [Cyanobacteria bacterium HKST-UBA05]MCA9799383.1 signal peptidase II [Cyanobacteria bacterium HKST-UBA04]MCA9807202.1 signal peptidase II [Cyanobacteria bacterium HKST-UBA06]MCA9841039.1 signal peptidase II [Cyanobacteria bacterium HKST-UBA03]
MKPETVIRPYSVLLGCALLVFVLDRLSKAMVMARMALGDSVPLWPSLSEGLLHITYVRNTGAAFSLFSHYPQALFWVGAGLVGLMGAVSVWCFVKKIPVNTLLAVVVGFVLGGAAGNLLDRWQFGAVVDFIDVQIIHYPVFNVADSFICIGVLLGVMHYVWCQTRPAG